MLQNEQLTKSLPEELGGYSLLSMNRIILVLTVCILQSVLSSAQVLKERRVYYLDCSFSMKQLGIWDDVRNNLKTAIDNVVDETIELIVIPFADNCLTDPALKPMREFATSAGKAKLKAQIDALPMNKSTKTYHYIPIRDFFDKRVDNDRVTYMFLMTDGQDEDKPQRALKDLLPQWGAKYGNRNVYGFYVMLHPNAGNLQIDKVCDSQAHLWKVATADVNINLVRLQSSAIFNAKNERYFDLPICGDASGKSFTASFPEKCLYKVTKTEKTSNSIRVWVEHAAGQQLPVSCTYNLNVKMTGGGQFDFLVTEEIAVKCEYKPERSLKIAVR